jgi:hypothetical protein
MKDHYLVHAANVLHRALPIHTGADRDPDPQALLTFLDVGCVTLSRLSEDRETQALIQKALADDPERYAGYLNQYADQFVAVDRALMISCGMDSVLVSHIFSNADAIRTMLKDPRKLHPDQLVERLKQLQYAVCREKNLLADRERIRRTMNVVSGAAIIVVNGTAAVLLSDVTCAVSGIVGSIIFDRGTS